MVACNGRVSNSDKQNTKTRNQGKNQNTNPSEYAESSFFHFFK